MENTCIFKERGLFIKYNPTKMYSTNYMEEMELEFFPCCYLVYIEPFDRIKLKDFLEMNNTELSSYLNNIRKNQLDFSVMPQMLTCNPPCTCVGKELKYLNVSLDTSCNLHCRMCRAGVHISKEETEIYYKVLDKCRGLHLDVLELTTVGEPFLYKERALEFLNSLTPDDTKQVNIITNGTLLSKEYIDKLEDMVKKTGVYIRVSVSIDSIDEIGYKLVRGGDFNRVVENTEYLNSKKMLTSVLCTISMPVLHQVPNVKKFWADKGIDVVLHLARPVKTNARTQLTKSEFDFCKKSKVWQEAGIAEID